MPDIALGVVVLTRTDKLSGLLESVEQQPIDKVYIADNGKMTPEKKQLYNEDFVIRARGSRSRVRYWTRI